MPQTKSKYYSIYEITYRLWKINGIFVSQILFHEAEVVCTHISRGLRVVLIWAMVVFTLTDCFEPQLHACFRLSV